MTRRNRPPVSRCLASRHIASIALFGALAAISMASPVAAQYGGTPSLFVDPVQVEIDGSFDAVGFNCPGASVVTITIDGFPGVSATTITMDDNSYGVADIDMPDGVIAGNEYDVRASCDGGTSTFRITAVCNGGSLPIDGNCPDGQAVGGQDPNPSNATTAPGSGGTAGGGDGGDGSSSSTGDDGGGTNLAVTGASFADQALQLSATLIGLGGILVLLTRRRRDESTA